MAINLIRIRVLAAAAIFSLLSCCGCAGPRSVANSAAAANEAPANDEEAESRAEKISNIVRNMDGVDDVAVTVTGKTAIVAVSLTKDLEDGDLVKLKRRIRDNTRRADPKTHRVAVSSAAEAFMDIKGEDRPPLTANDELYINTIPKF